MLTPQRFLLLLTLLSATLLAACGGARGRVHRDFRVSIERTACYGDCPSYVVQVNALGEVTYVGRSHVEKTGTWTKNLPFETVVVMKNMLKEANLGQYEDKYDGNVTDVPSMTLFTDLGRKNQHRIYMRANYPKKLETLVQRLEAKIDLDQGFDKLNDKKLPIVP